MKILRTHFLEAYRKKFPHLLQEWEKFCDRSISWDLEYIKEASSVYSSNIEGNSLNINSFQNLKHQKNKNKDLKEIQDLVKAYSVAETSQFTEENFLKIHSTLSKELLIAAKRWVYRDEKIWVFWDTWLVYLAIEAEKTEYEMTKLWSDIKELQARKLDLAEIFYFASYIHLVFVHIHPFSDGNGRSARILEKLFLAYFLWEKAWKIPSERFYKENRKLYYENINLWVNYYELDYTKSLPFLEMLPSSLSDFNI